MGFGVLGPLQMTVDGAPVSLGTPKQRAVLALLVMNRNRPVSTDSLITAAWEEWPPAEARASLHSYVSNLRRLVSGAGADPKSVLVNAPPGYRLNVADTACGPNWMRSPSRSTACSTFCPATNVPFADCVSSTTYAPSS